MQKLFPYKAVSHDISVQVSVSFHAQRSDISRGRWFWIYHIRIENSSAIAVKLLSRHWVITDGRGNVSHVAGEGVIGKQPLLEPGDSYDYVSGCPLPTHNGRMEGSYQMVTPDDRMLQVTIPRFQLTAPAVQN